MFKTWKEVVTDCRLIWITEQESFSNVFFFLFIYVNTVFFKCRLEKANKCCGESLKAISWLLFLLMTLLQQRVEFQQMSTLNVTRHAN